MDNKEFYDNVKDLREKQRKYFHEHNRSLLNEFCRPLERLVDYALDNDAPPELDAARVFRRMVRTMRGYQRSFVARYSKDTLIRAKMAERKVDKYIEVVEANMARLREPRLNFG